MGILFQIVYEFTENRKGGAGYETAQFLQTVHHRLPAE